MLNHTGSPIKQATISKPLLVGLSLFAFACLTFLSYIVFDYFYLKKTFFNTLRLESSLSSQLDEIATQRKQIQNLAKDINSLKANLIALNSFEKKIRIIGNIEKSSDQDGLFGVGGSIPEDLNTEIDLTERHNSLIREMHEQVEQINQASANQATGFESLLKYLEDQRNILASTPAVRPVNGWITSRFGYRISPFTGGREFHKGLDIATRKLTPIIATADGVVTDVSVKGLLGKVIVVDHGHGMATRYGHIEKSLKKIHETVKRGDEIALVGSSGRTTGSHVHYEVLLNGIQVNPEKYILN